MASSTRCATAGAQRPADEVGVARRRAARLTVPGVPRRPPARNRSVPAAGATRAPNQHTQSPGDGGGACRPRRTPRPASIEAERAETRRCSSRWRTGSTTSGRARNAALAALAPTRKRRGGLVARSLTAGAPVIPRRSPSRRGPSGCGASTSSGRSRNCACGGAGPDRPTPFRSARRPGRRRAVMQDRTVK